MTAGNGRWKDWIIGIVGALIVVAVAAQTGVAVRVAGEIGEIRATLGAATKALDGVKEELRDLSNTRHTKQDAERDAQRFERRFERLEEKLR